MEDLLTSSISLEKLKGSNYSTLCKHIKYYLKGQDLWDIVGGDEKIAPIDPTEKRSGRLR